MLEVFDVSTHGDVMPKLVRWKECKACDRAFHVWRQAVHRCSEHPIVATSGEES
jgi:hypothetical protein